MVNFDLCSKLIIVNSKVFKQLLTDTYCTDSYTSFIIKLFKIILLIGLIY